MKKYWNLAKEWIIDLYNKIVSTFSVTEGSDKLHKKRANIQILKWLGVMVIFVFIILKGRTPTPSKKAEQIYLSDIKNRGAHTRLTATFELNTNEEGRYIDVKNEIKKQNAHENPFLQESNFGRKFNSSQILVNNDASAFSLLPGTFLKARLINKIDSRSQNSPVVALISEPYYHLNSLVIEAESKILGTASFDEKAKKVNIHFDTITYPDYTKKPFSGVALDLADSGSSGLSGNYHSGTGGKIAGSLLSQFISGAATGLKDQDTSFFWLISKRDTQKWGIRRSQPSLL